MADQHLVNSRKRYNLRSRSQPAPKRFKSSEEEGPDKRSSHTQSSLPSLINLNSDCLFEIFKYLDVTDLCNLSDVCATLKFLSKQYFSHEYNKKDSTLFQMTQALLASESKTPLVYARSLLSNFGENIVQMKMTYGSPFAETSDKPNHRAILKLLELIAKYCKNMTDFTVHRFQIKQCDVKIWKSLFANLTRLNLMYCDVYNMYTVLSFCSKLIYLKLDHMVYENLEMLTNLEVIKLTHCNLLDYELMNLIRVNKNLTKLSIIRCPFILEEIDFKEISNLNLREFELNQHLHPENLYFEKEIQQLSEIKSLEKLSLNTYGCSVSSLISNLVIKRVPIQHLHLTNGPISDQMINDIAKLTSIKTLKLESLENEYLVKLTSELKSLVELEVKKSKVTHVTIRKVLLNSPQLTILRIGSPNFKIDDTVYDELLDIVKRRHPELKLDIVVYDSDTTVPSEKMLKNEKILSISTMSLFIIDLFMENLECDFETGDELEYDTDNDSDEGESGNDSDNPFE